MVGVICALSQLVPVLPSLAANAPGTEASSHVLSLDVREPLSREEDANHTAVAVDAKRMAVPKARFQTAAAVATEAACVARSLNALNGLRSTAAASAIFANARRPIVNCRSLAIRSTY
ncbi:unnamed protein product [Aphanomyces euteiches]|uniref:Secreted protein n=1 Tax=Aphanomyces euteiches TaxID=100861 RepID=A0A6G0XE30_9STRA|nr:hypothetical protein Ae201684_005815 [Aphanomyces euteiches]KAH9078282.1 hypothetical protein Ae201684P_019373 [Aphanomyces euteiches]KAH9144564.1 hypothetical protein AeRB84_011483 [Aphanomyces euteiches]